MSGHTAYNFLFAAGGTGGHLFPAIAVAEELKNISPNSKILFIGTKKKLESRIIPELGFNFKTIWVSGFSRKFNFQNLLFPIKLVVSIFQSFFIRLNFRPNVAVGAGAYVSGPIIWISSLFGSKIVLLEQNSYPGVTNRMLENKADKIHISFEDSRKYFKNSSKLELTGNPVRNNLQLFDKIAAKNLFKLNPEKKVLLIIGGSLGARSLNQAVAKCIEQLNINNVQVIWQTGEFYYNEYKHLESESIKIVPFVTDMKMVYSACDLLVARAGATTIAEVAYLGLPVVFVPSTNVAANHQYKNAKSIVDARAGILIEDHKLSVELSKTVISTIKNEELLSSLSENITKFSKPNAAKDIALSVLSLAEQMGDNN